MALRKVIQEGDPILSQKARRIDRFDERLFELLDDMKETMAHKDGIGLAAPQIGVLRQVAVIRPDEDGPFLELVNPSIKEEEGQQEGVEGCLSCPGEYGITTRPQKIKVWHLTREGRVKIFEAEDLLARAVCHEIDHLNGILFKKHVVRWISESELENGR